MSHTTTNTTGGGIICHHKAIATIDNICHYGYETNKRHLNQASFAPPTKFINIFVSERNY